jgi:hypothetical protein
LRAWLGVRPDLQLPAIAASLVTHLALLSAFAMIGYAAHTEINRSFTAQVVDTKLSDFATFETTTALAEIDATTMMPSAASTAPRIAPLISDPVDNPTLGATANLRPMAQSASEPLTLDQPPISLTSTALTLPGAPRLDSSLAIQGTGAEHVGGVEGAVDRVAVEVLRKMEKGPTLVVWAFDASGSLLAERKRLAEHIDAVYEHIDALDSERYARTGGLLTAVVAFGKERRVLAEPTVDRAAIRKAIDAVYLDESGVENTFTMVADAARRFGAYKGDGGVAYTAMMVLVTDEVGDDEEALDTAIAASKRAGMTVYVLGSPALFGRVEGTMDYTDPKTKERFRNLPVRQGPESAMVEGVKLPFWYGGSQYDMLDSGFGPWALSRLAGATGGIYFITRLNNDRITFDPAGMREYEPDWSSRDRFQADLAKNPLRLAVTQAGQITRQNLPGQPDLLFPPADSPQFKEAMARNQEIAARVMYTVDEALGPIAAAARYRDREPSRRWQAHFDLIRGRLLAVKLRCYEYNWTCAQMKKDPKTFTDPKHNAWRLVPAAEVRSSAKAAAAADEAKMLLEKVVAEHPGTPWALLAQRELRDPFGFQWVATYVPPPPRPSEAAAAAKAQTKKAQAPPRREPPKL